MRLSSLRAAAALILCLSMRPALAEDGARQSLDDAWWTGPILANSAHTLPQGHALIENYLFDDIQGAGNSYRSYNYLLYGLTDRWTVGLIPVGGINAGSGRTARWGMNDLTLQLQYGLTAFDPDSGTPDIALAAREIFPTGRYDGLTNANAGFGAGAYATTLAFFLQDYFWLPNGRLLRARFDLYQTFSDTADVRDASVYGTGVGFLGSARPGDTFTLDTSLEYSVTRNWVLALEMVYDHGNATHVRGGDGSRPVNFDLGSSDGFGLAPALEYSWNPDWGVLVGTRILMGGHNRPFSITPAVALNHVL